MNTGDNTDVIQQFLHLKYDGKIDEASKDLAHHSFTRSAATWNDREPNKTIPWARMAHVDKRNHRAGAYSRSREQKTPNTTSAPSRPFFGTL
ncbi:hypothetical protein [Maribacter sp. 2-571]|uniref:hypothetical protein n=1 Tax=Maribacter sp. 2-571 TaxID=3417569 RepID=UPI003D34B4FF